MKTNSKDLFIEDKDINRLIFENEIISNKKSEAEK